MSLISVELKNQDSEVHFISLDDSFYHRIKPYLKNIYPNVGFFQNYAAVSFSEFISNEQKLENFLEAFDSSNNDFCFDERLLQQNKSIETYQQALMNECEISEDNIEKKLSEISFKRKLKWYQMRNLKKVTSFNCAADFSVPGSGKTSVGLAFHFVKNVSANGKLLVFCPKNALGAWDDEYKEIFETDESPFVRLKARESELQKLFRKENKFYIANYEYVRNNSLLLRLISEEMLKNPNYTVILDESHRIKDKSGATSQIAYHIAPLVKNKLILSGTPMPNKIGDLEPQFNFLYPKTVINSGDQLQDAFQPIYARTSKKDFEDEMPKMFETIHKVQMSGAQRSVYEVLGTELAKLAIHWKRKENLRNFEKAVLRMIKFLSNPMLMQSYFAVHEPKLAELLRDQGFGAKMNQLISDAIGIAEREKVLIWTNFPDNIELLKQELLHLNPVTIYGASDSGDKNDPTTREYSVHQFNNNPDCRVLIANPMSASEGISLHKVCKRALYLDRTYNAAQYLQSRDRIHRIGSDIGDVNISIYQYKATEEDKIERKLKKKINNLSKFLNDTSLVVNKISLDAPMSDTEEQEELYIFDSQDDLQDAADYYLENFKPK